jgi:hypothetical protein
VKLDDGYIFKRHANPLKESENPKRSVPFAQNMKSKVNDDPAHQQVAV